MTTAAPSRLGPLPVVNLVVLEAGLALGGTLLSRHAALGCAALLIAAPLTLGRWHGRWLLEWVQLAAGYLLRPHRRRLTSPGPVAPGSPPSPLQLIVGSVEPRSVEPRSVEPRLAMLRLLVPDLSVAHSIDHQRAPLGLAWQRGTWTAMLEVDAIASMVLPLGASPSLPLSALASCLEYRGVVLDAIQVTWQCYSGSTALSASSPALRAYLEVLGPLSAPARRTTWVALRLDPRRCPAAVAERGGGALGCHRALIGALSRVRSALESQGISTRPLDPDQLMRAGISAAELSAAAGTAAPVALCEGWTSVSVAGVGHASYVISGWGIRGVAPNLTAVAGVRARSATVALSLSPGSLSSGADGAEVGLRGLLRLSARDPGELQAAERRLQALSPRLGVALRPLPGRQLAGLAATLPLGVPG
ncbi:MAG: type VII secretion protein EccE [Pseudonocardiales bacterium]|nr:type VII secretion protein EccE [Pseudonocardiales bacterium]